MNHVAGQRCLGATDPTCSWVRIDDGVVAATGAGPAPTGATELPGVLLAPALCDLQVNGVGAFDFGVADVSVWQSALAALAEEGVASCLPTIVSRRLDAYEDLLRVAAEVAADPAPARARVAGVHLEGPFLARAGAHDPSALRPVDLDWLADILARHGDLVRMVTLAPEADPGLAATRLLCGAGVTVAIGHTDADYETVVAAADAGATVATHLYNGMAPFHHRSPGPIGAALERLVPTLVVDRAHVHPAGIRLAVRASRRTVVVSDRVADRGLERRGGAFVLPGTDTLAGSATSLPRALANLVTIGIDVDAAIAMVTATPHDLIGETGRGRIRPGAPADLVALDAQTLRVVAVWRDGVRLPVG